MDFQEHRPEERHGNDTDFGMEDGEMKMIEMIGIFILMLGALWLLASN